jgi:hypothetical protein
MLVVLVFAIPAAAQSRLTAVDPMNAKTGDLVAAAGQDCDKAKVVELYLTDGTNDHKVVIVEQSGDAIKFKVPSAKPGRYALMIKTAGAAPKLLEQPVKLTVE